MQYTILVQIFQSNYDAGTEKFLIFLISKNTCLLFIEFTVPSDVVP